MISVLKLPSTLVVYMGREVVYPQLCKAVSCETREGVGVLTWPGVLICNFRGGGGVEGLKKNSDKLYSVYGMYLLLPLNRCCNTPRSIKHGPFVAPDLVRQNVTSMKARSGSIHNCGIAHSARVNLESLCNCALRTTKAKMWTWVLRTSKTYCAAHLCESKEIVLHWHYIWKILSLLLK